MRKIELVIRSNVRHVGIGEADQLDDLFKAKVLRLIYDRLARYGPSRVTRVTIQIDECHLGGKSAVQTISGLRRGA